VPDTGVRPWIAAIFVGGLSLLLWHLSIGLGRVWPLAWLVPVPSLLWAFRHRLSTTIAIAFLSSLAGQSSLVTAYGLGALPIIVPVAIAFTVAVIAARIAAKKEATWIAIGVFPMAMTALEFLWSRLSLDGTFGSVGYSQADFTWLLQVVSLTGLSGLVFVLTLVPSAVAFAVDRRSIRLLIPAAVCLAAALGFGVVRLSLAADRLAVRVGLTASDRGLPHLALGMDASSTLAAVEQYVVRIQRLSKQGAAIVVLPEKIVGVGPDLIETVIQHFSDAARIGRVTVVVGLSRIGVVPQRNVALVFGPNGHLVAEYEKHHLVPIIERAFASGNRHGFFTGPAGSWGVEICKDLDFPSWSRGYGQQGIEFLAVPAWNSVGDGRLHARMAMTRAVENGFALARSAQQGVITLTDAYGRILVEEVSSTDPVVAQDLPAGPGATMYARYGDWFAWLAVGISGIWCVRQLREMKAASESTREGN
jgi:apolipoprotein N-acyltransferase